MSLEHRALSVSLDYQVGICGRTAATDCRASFDIFTELHGHQSIEEQYIFPVLAQKMPQFQEDHLEEVSEHDTLAALCQNTQMLSFPPFLSFSLC